MSDSRPVSEPRILPRSDHPISRKNIDSTAQKVLYRLHRSGYRACLVGGGVRDLMLGIQPKDFDAVTDARPEEIRRLFRNSRIIGRRFRLAHVYFKEGIIEVSTFRRDPDPDAQTSAPGELLITSDNTFGTPRQDAFRRDFTVNALFYDIADFSVIDYVGGIRDLERKLIRVIGDPSVRFQEDPVRMLRACEFAARLGFGIETETQQAIHRHRARLAQAAPARVTEEIVQLLRCRHAGAAMQWMQELDLLDELVPEARAMIRARDTGLGDFAQIVPVIDTLIEEGETLSDAALLAALLLPEVLLARLDAERKRSRQLRRNEHDRLVRAAVEPFFSRFALPRTRAQEILHALDTFELLGEAGGGEAERLRLARRPSFGDALRLLEILVRATGDGAEVLESWRRIASQVPGDVPEEEGRARPRKHRGRRRRRPRRRRKR